MNIPHYHINLYWSEEDDCFIGDIPDLKHCTGQGDTPEEALEDLSETRDAWLDACVSAGEDMPAPSYRSTTNA